MTRAVAIDPLVPDTSVLTEAAAVLRRGGLVAFPTETFYGLGAAALQPAAVRRIVEVKGRPDGKPLLVLVDSLAMVDAVALEVPPRARALMTRHWPGALTLVLRARPEVPGEVTAGSGTVGVRFSPHPVARALVTALGAPITAPSANPSDGRRRPPPPRCARTSPTASIWCSTVAPPPAASRRPCWTSPSIRRG